MLSDSTFYFTSMRADVEEDHDRLFETSWYCNIYQSKLLADGNYADIEPMSNVVNARNAFNSNFCFNEKEDLIIYSRCVKDGDGGLHCALWQSKWDGEKWEKPRKLPEVINKEGSSNMQPHLVTTADREILYFVSDRAQGIGGYDIWYSVVKEGKYDTPINVGATINTEGNEVTPFYDKANGILYFSSDEHLGVGEYDIFYSTGALSQWGEVSNMGVPFNSEYNDYYLTVNTDGKSGFFSSNRPHDGLDLIDTCCNDLFHYQWKPTLSEPVAPVDTPSLQEKIASVLPITLYFQNDQPDPRSVSDTTAADYVTLYRKYMADNDLYIAKSGRGLSGTARQEVTQEMIDFLRDSVSTGYHRLMQLEQYLKESLLRGDTVELLVSGFASPLHNSDYNKNLSMRRITSLLNHLRKADNGFFLPYLDQEIPGLIIRMDPQGAVNHTFKTNESRETVYGLQAAKDRKIVITQ